MFIATFNGSPKTGDDASDFEWIDLHRINDCKLAFDHQKILKDYVKWKETKETFWSTKKLEHFHFE